MATREKVYPKGIFAFPKREGAPDFVLGSVAITMNELVKFCKENEQYLSEYRGEKQLKLNILEGDKGIYFTVDTYKPKDRVQEDSNDDDDLPF